MTCDCIESGKPLEGNTGHTASCNHAQRKAERQALKPIKKPVKIAKLGTKNTFQCSDGSRVTQAEISKYLIESYKAFGRDVLRGASICEGCGQPSTCHAHIIAQSRCKHIGKTELIWDMNNYFASCFECNSAIENPKGQEWKKLKNIGKCLTFMAIHDPELYTKFRLYGGLCNEQEMGEFKGLSEMFSRLSTEPHKI